MFGGPDPVDGPASGQLEDPGSPGTQSGIELTGSLPDGQHHLVGDFLALVSIAEQSGGQGQDRGDLIPVEVVEGDAVAGRDPFQQ